MSDDEMNFVLSAFRGLRVKVDQFEIQLNRHTKGLTPLEQKFNDELSPELREQPTPVEHNH